MIEVKAVAAYPRIIPQRDWERALIYSTEQTIAVCKHKITCQIMPPIGRIQTLRQPIL